MNTEQKIKEIFAALKSERLSERERFVMRSELELLMKKHPVRPPFYIQLIDHWYAPGAMGSTFVGRHIFASAFALVLIVGVGSSYAAEGALPGDALYPMKVYINEQVVGALAVSEQDKVDWSAELTERRLEEVEALAADGTLTVEKSIKAVAYFDKATREFDDKVAALSAVPDKEEQVADASTMHEVSLAAHANVLEKMSKRIPEVSEALSPVIAKVKNKVEGRRGKTASAKAAPSSETAPMMMAMQADTATEVKVESRKGADKDAQKKARTNKERAQKRIEGVRALAEKSKNTLGTSTYRYVHEEASSTLSVIKSADTAAEQGDYDKAIQTYQSALQVAVEAEAGLNAQIRLDQSVRASGKSDTIILINGEKHD